jgi:hypothetical protein
MARRERDRSSGAPGSRRSVVAGSEALAPVQIASGQMGVPKSRFRSNNIMTGCICQFR